MMHILRRRWPIIAASCLVLCAAGLALAGADDEPEKDDVTNSVGMKLKLIKPGKFLMGSPKDAKDTFDDEGPQHPVEITRPFYLGVFPVTRGQFAAFVKDAAYQTEAEKESEKYTWRNPFFGNSHSDDEPVVEVSWNDAVRFCKWLTKKEGKTYNLPTEAEWEYACRAGTTTVHFYGDDENDLGDYAWYGANSGGHTHPVGGRKPNALGLYDMYGNVHQWCADWYGEYQQVTCKDPRGPESGHDRVLRGGYWADVARYCRSAVRYNLAPATYDDFTGFRVVARPSERAP